MLSAEASKALQDFYVQRDYHQKQLEDLRTQAEDGERPPTVSIDAFTEDWNVSQFWVDGSLPWNTFEMPIPFGRLNRSALV